MPRPKAHSKPTIAMNAPEPRSRLAEQKARGVTPEMPPVSHAAAPLLGWWLDVGPTQPGGMGDVPLAYGEIAAWSRTTATPLEPWQAQLLRHLSREFLDARAKGADPMALPPWQVVAEEQKRAAGAELSRRLHALATVHEQEAARRAGRTATPANLPDVEH